MKSWTSTGYFLNSIDSYVTSGGFSMFNNGQVII